jgi:ABC-type antimicrobial peptide transport system permease subunit
MKEMVKEVYASIVQHKMRSLLTGFGIAWGIFILIVLLAAGNGFRSGMLALFGDYASNSIWVTGQWVSQAKAEGVQSGSRVRFDESLIGKSIARCPRAPVEVTPFDQNMTAPCCQNKNAPCRHVIRQGFFM